MARSSNQKLKLIYILDILKKYSDEDHPLNAVDIAEHLSRVGINAERKAIYNDIECLEDYGCDIIRTTTPKKGCFIGDRDFEIPEIYLLSDAVRSANFISAKKTRELLAKLGGMLSVHQSKRRGSGVFFAEKEKSGNEEIYYSIDAVSRAIEEKKQIKIEYLQRGFDQNRQVSFNKKEMVINPYALCWEDDHYYLLGNHSKYDNLIHLRLDRISHTEILKTDARHFSEVSDYKEFFDTADYTYRLFGMHGGNVEKVEFRCSKAITEQVLDRFSEDIFITGVNETEFCFTVEAAISEALVTFVINYGENLKVLKPQKLKDMICERAQLVLNTYKNGED